MNYRDIQDQGGWSYRQFQDESIKILTAPSSNSSAKGKTYTSGSVWNDIRQKFGTYANYAAMMANSNFMDTMGLSNNGNTNANANANGNSNVNTRDFGDKLYNWVSPWFADTESNSNTNLSTSGSAPVIGAGSGGTGMGWLPYVAIGGAALLIVGAIVIANKGEDDVGV